MQLHCHKGEEASNGGILAEVMPIDFSFRAAFGDLPL
jgi:hypothetical protein